MRYILIYMALLFVACSSLPIDATVESQCDYFIIENKGAAIRKEPRNSSEQVVKNKYNRELVSCIEQREINTSNGSRETWFKIRTHDNHEGWISGAQGYYCDRSIPIGRLYYTMIVKSLLGRYIHRSCLAPYNAIYNVEFNERLIPAHVVFNYNQYDSLTSGINSDVYLLSNTGPEWVLHSITHDIMLYREKYIIEKSTSWLDVYDITDRYTPDERPIVEKGYRCIASLHLRDISITAVEYRESKIAFNPDTGIAVATVRDRPNGTVYHRRYRFTDGKFVPMK